MNIVDNKKVMEVGDRITTEFTTDDKIYKIVGSFTAPNLIKYFAIGYDDVVLNCYVLEQNFTWDSDSEVWC